MAVRRNKQESKPCCGNKKKPQAVAAQSPPPTLKPLPEESQRLWTQLTRGMEGIFNIARTYEDAGLEGNPLPALTEIHKDLGVLIKRIKVRITAPSPSNVE